jgi:nucleoside 2-deoxyribosyltransferase
MPSKPITICSSSRFYDTAKAVARDLEMHGYEVLTPRFDANETQRVVSPDEKYALTTDFLKKVQRSGAIYVISEGGYTGVSVCIEVGYAYAQGIPVLTSETPTEAAIGALVTAIVPTSGIADHLRSVL